jgi:hypothetical protein
MKTLKKYKLVDDTLTIYLDHLVNVPLFLEVLLKYIYKSIEIDYVNANITGKVKKYYNQSIDEYHSSNWTDCPYDKFEKCPICNNRKNSSTSIQYFFKLAKHFDYDWHIKCEIDSYDYYDNNSSIISILKNETLVIIEKLHKFLQSHPDSLYTSSGIHFKSDNLFNFVNKDGVNPDRRGSDHLEVILPFESEIYLSCNSTFYELLVVAHKIKSHKFENNYELFCGVSNLTYQGKNNYYCVKVELSFDHGS